MKDSDLSNLLISWYRKNARRMPWRDNPEPYAVWISEIMLQQTRVETVIPFFEKWMLRYPTVDKLAASNLQEVLSYWEGLGYYSRARNLYKTAKIVAKNYGGKLPTDVKLLRELPGIGPYTAGAIASIAFGLNEPLLDGNVRRVLSRIFNLEIPADSQEGKRVLWGLAAEHLPDGQAGDYNQALMELGATICFPRNPQCKDCPVNLRCEANRLSVQNSRPILKPKQSTPHFIVTAAVIRKEEMVLITQRPENGLLGGLWEFPGGKLDKGEDLVTCLRREIKEELGVSVNVTGKLGIFKHAYTHFKVTLHAFGCDIQEGQIMPIEVKDFRWVRISDLEKFPMGKIDREISKRLLTNANSLML